jgi:hypothetical protein
MPVLKTITQRLFGRTVIDSLDLNQNAWYIDEEQVTVTAANLNAIPSITPVTATVDVANDDVLFLDHSGSHVVGYDSFPDLMTAVAGTHLQAAAGVLSVTPTSLGTAMGTGAYGIMATAGVLQQASYGNLAIGAVKFGGAGDCTSVNVGGVAVYTRDGTPDVTLGEWTEGAGAAASATNLAAAINGDTRNAGGPYFGAFVDVDGDTVFIYSLTPTADVPITRTGGAEPATVETQAGGLGAPVVKKQAMVSHTVTALDVDTTATFSVPLPFAPTMFIIQVRSSAGVQKVITDQVTIAATPNRLLITSAGATHCIAGDIITVNISE